MSFSSRRRERGRSRRNRTDTDRSEAKVFGEKARYWELHNDIVAKFDQAAVDRLNARLDNLLIFVSVSRSSGSLSEADKFPSSGWLVFCRRLGVRGRSDDKSHPWRF